MLEAAQSGGRTDLSGALDEALATTRRLQATVEDVLSLHREDSQTPSVDRAHHLPTGRDTVERVIDGAASRWHGAFAAAGRQLSHGCERRTRCPRPGP